MDPSRPQRRNSGAHFCLVNLAVGFVLQRGLSLQALPSPFPLISCHFVSLLGDAPLPIQDAQSTPSPLHPGRSCQQLSSGSQCPEQAALHTEEQTLLSRLIFMTSYIAREAVGDAFQTPRSCMDSWTLPHQPDTPRNWQRDKLHSLAWGFISVSVTNSYTDRHPSQPHRLPLTWNSICLGGTKGEDERAAGRERKTYG